MKEIPEDLIFVVDGNPIYLLAQHFFAQHDIAFDVKQVIGLTNEDPVSTEYRPLKQIIERLNRIFKGNYLSMFFHRTFDTTQKKLAEFSLNFDFISKLFQSLKI